MGNIGSHTGQISGSRVGGLRTELGAKRGNSGPESWVRSCPRTGAQPHIKVLPDPESRQRLRHTNNGEILHSGGTLSGRHQPPSHNVNSRPYTPTQRYSFHKTGLGAIPYQNRQNVSSQKSLEAQLKSSRSEPDLRFPSAMVQEMKEKKFKKKYKAPPPPTNGRMEGKRSTDWEENFCDEYPSRRTRLFKTRVETKKESSQTNTCEQAVESSSDIAEEKIHAKENVISLRPKSLAELSFAESNEFKKELREATDRLRTAKIDAKKVCKTSENVIRMESPPDHDPVSGERFIRGEPSGKESSTPETSPVLGVMQKPRAFYFGMEREDSDASSCCPVEDDEENPTIALRLRPVLPRKPTQIPRFSPATAWKLLDSRSLDSGISGDARPPLSSSWTPQQDLGDDSSLDDAIREEPRSSARQRPHVFSLSLPRDHQPAAFLAMATNKSGVSSLRRLKRSVSGVLNTLASRKEQDKRTLSKDDDSNWFFTRSAPNSLNENIPEIPDSYFPHISSTARLMYLPETTMEILPMGEKYSLPAFSKSCEELRVPESLRDMTAALDMPWSKIDRPKKTKKFTFQSTVRQIERKRMADRLSKEAEKKEKQRLRELEAMRRVEEEFQRKRAKEKANIRQQLRLYAMDDNQWTSLPLDMNVKTEERQEPEGALSSSTSSSSPPPKCQEDLKKLSSVEGNVTSHVTQELSEYRQVQRDYKDYRGHTKYVADNRHFRQTTVHPEVTCNMPNAKGSNLENGNYRKDFAYGMKSTKSIGSNQSEDSQHNYSPKIYRNKYSPITRF